MSHNEEARFERRKVGPVSDVPIASRLLTLLEDTQARRRGVSIEVARSGIARALRIPATTLRHIRIQRRKTVESFLLSGIRDQLIVTLQQEIAEIEHELCIARQVGLDVREDAYLQASAAIATARAILERATGPG
jgi:hypothetical protein